jgi:ribulose-phosphate 3-epimerase
MPPLYRVLPALIAQSQEELDQMLEQIPFANNIMLDLMDGEFVGAKSLCFKMALPNGSRYQLHVMAINPMKIINSLPHQVDTVILHAETLDDIEAAIVKTKEKGLGVFVALNPETHISIIEPHITRLDGVLIMSVHPGQYGAKFLPDQLNKVRKLREMSNEINIEVDGGMTDKTIGLAIAAGANMIASGSFIMKSPDPETAFNILNRFFKQLKE